MNFRRNSFSALLGALLFVSILLAFASFAFAQNVSTVDMGATNKLGNAVGTTGNLGNTIPIDEQTQVGVLIKFQGDASGTDIAIVQLKRVNENGVAETSPPSTLRFTNAATGTTAVVAYHQVPKEVIGSVYGLALFSGTNASGTVNLTNFSVSIVKKGEKSRGP